MLDEVSDGFDAVIAPGNHVRDGSDILDELDTYGMPVFVVPGTKDDSIEDFRSRTRDLEHVVCVHDWVAETDGVHIVGKGGMAGPEYPQSKEELQGKSVEELKDLREDYDAAYE
ncbi:MAG: hypothetical protein ABEI52_00290, partial [Halobacteriaceae archaeon]